GGVEGRISPLQPFGDVFLRPYIGQPRAGGDAHFATLVEDGTPSNSRPQLFRPLANAGSGGRGKDNSEFLSAKSSDHVGVAGLLPKSLRDVDQRLISRHVAERIVELLEMIDVEHQ